MSTQAVVSLATKRRRSNARRAALTALVTLSMSALITPAQALPLAPMEEGTPAPSGENVTTSESAQGSDTPAAPAVAGVELPDKEDYVCIAPHRYEIAAKQDGTRVRLVLNDLTTDAPTDRENFTVIPVPDVAMRQVTEEDVTAGFAPIASAGTQVWTLPVGNDPAIAHLTLNPTAWNWAEVNRAGVRVAFGTVEGPGVVSMWTLDQDKRVQLHVQSNNDEVELAFDNGSTALPINTSFVAAGNYEATLAFMSNFQGRSKRASYTTYFAVGDAAVRAACGDSFIPSTPDTGATQPPAPSQNTPAEPNIGTPTPPTSDTDTETKPDAENAQSPAGSTTVPTGENADAAQSTPPSQGQTTPDRAQSDAHSSSTEDKEHSASSGTNSTSTNTDTALKPQTGHTPVGTPGATTTPVINQLDKNGQENARLARLHKQREEERKSRQANTAPETCTAVVITRESEEHEADKVRHAQAQQGSARTTLNFTVGDNARGNATEGHFDLGPVIDNNTIYARVKDDRTQPAQWVDPSAVTFALGGAAALTAPAGMESIAPAGKTVWMIQQSQRPNVPWVGMNSQHPSVLKETTGDVTFTLESVDGPGAVAVFESGAFGSGIGAMVFNGPGASYTIGANTHAHHNWVFTEPGTYTLTLSMSVKGKNGPINGSGSIGGFTVTGEIGPNGRPMIQEVVGRTESGAACDLAAGGATGLAKTGANALHFLVLAAAVAFLGAYLTSARKQNA